MEGQEKHPSAHPDLVPNSQPKNSWGSSTFAPSLWGFSSSIFDPSARSSSTGSTLLRLLLHVLGILPVSMVEQNHLTLWCGDFSDHDMIKKHQGNCENLWMWDAPPIIKGYQQCYITIQKRGCHQQSGFVKEGISVKERYHLQYTRREYIYTYVHNII